MVCGSGAKTGGAARCLILQHAAIVTGFARPWRRFALTSLARRSWKHSGCLQCTCICWHCSLTG